MTKTTPFCCPVCGCTSYEALARANARPAFACCGCTLVFMDPVKFTRLGKPEAPEPRGNAWGQRGSD